MPTIVSQIEVKETEVETFEDRLENIEKIIRVKKLTDAELKSLQDEESRLKKRLKDSKKDLSGLRKENWKTSVISFAIFGLVAGLYIAVYGS